MIDIGFDRISPTPDYPPGVDKSKLHTRDWSKSSGHVGKFKSGLKPQLRRIQKARCCFCRRLLPSDDYGAHLEHFIEKSPHPEFTYEVLNLALSCGTCNFKKNGHDKSHKARMKKRYGPDFKARCASLSVAVVATAGLPAGPEKYRWVHPHFDSYSANIEIEKSWVFKGKTRKGVRTVKAMKLNDLAAVEQRALEERLESRGGRLSSLMLSLAAEGDFHLQERIAEAIKNVIERRRDLAVSAPG